MVHLSLVFGPLLGLLLYAMYWSSFLSWHTKKVIEYPAVPAAAAFIIAAAYLKWYPGYPEPQEAGKRALFDRSYVSEGDLEVMLARLREERKDLIANSATSTRVRRLVYREEAFADIDRLRSESNGYRRVNNSLQGVLIIGSLAATGAAGLATQNPVMRWAVMGLTFVVGISSGFMGYFKYKERSFYLQQTADAIEQEWEAFEVGVGRYKNYSEAQEGEALADFVEEVHRLKSEQRKRQQNLEQPADARESND